MTKEPVGGIGSRQRARQGFGPLVAGSAALHVALFAAVAIAAGGRSTPPLDLQALPVELVTLGKPRDPKLLPRKVRPPPPAPEPAPAPPSGESGSAAPTKDAVALEIEKKAAEAKKKEEARKAEKPSKQKRRLSAGARRLLEGGGRDDIDDVLERFEEPEGAEDGFVDGTTTDPSASANAYEAHVKAALKRNYELPAHLQARKQFLEAVVVLYIGPDGKILRHEFVQRHANEQFMAALEKLFATLELPPPPKDNARRYREEGLGIRFKP